MTLDLELEIKRAQALAAHARRLERAYDNLPRYADRRPAYQAWSAAIGDVGAAKDRIRSIASSQGIPTIAIQLMLDAI